jgi:hypothetical protein
MTPRGTEDTSKHQHAARLSPDIHELRHTRKPCNGLKFEDLGPAKDPHSVVANFNQLIND